MNFNLFVFRYGNPTVPRKIADALLNPIDALKKPLDFLINKGQELADTVTGKQNLAGKFIFPPFLFQSFILI